MEPTLTIGIIKETKVPQDVRVPLTPKQCQDIQSKYNVCIKIEPCSSRCYNDDEYREVGVEVTPGARDCNVLLGVKEVKTESLQEDKTYFMFSHTIKKQPYNRDLLRTILKKNIRLVDYECLQNSLGVRVISFSRWAGIVGAHNGIYTYGKRTGRFDLPRMHKCEDFDLVKSHSYKNLNLGSVKILLTGDGRVSTGSTEVLDAMKIRKVDVETFLKCEDFGEAVYCQLPANELYARDDGQAFNNGFFQNPQGYHSIFQKYLLQTDIIINGIYWDKRSPPLFTLDDLQKAKHSLRVQVIADITCDIAPNASIPSTVRPSTIADPIYGFNPISGEEDTAHMNHVIDVMAVDNLPNELPRDASHDFGTMFCKYVLPELLKEKGTTESTCVDSQQQYSMIKTASIAENGHLTPQYAYLQDYVDDGDV